MSVVSNKSVQTYISLSQIMNVTKVTGVNISSEKTMVVSYQNTEHVFSSQSLHGYIHAYFPTS